MTIEAYSMLAEDMRSDSGVMVIVENGKKALAGKTMEFAPKDDSHVEMGPKMPLLDAQGIVTNTKTGNEPSQTGKITVSENVTAEVEDFPPDEEVVF